MTSLLDFGMNWIQAIQSLSPALDIPMQFFTFLGKVEFYMLFVTFIYWLIDTRLGVRVFILLLTTDMIAMGVKQFFRQPRPYWLGGVKQLSVEPSYGLPSSHASDSLATWGYLAYRLRKRWMWVLALLLILLISFSRLYLAVHFPQDILVGWGIGFLVLWVFIKTEVRISASLNALPLKLQLGTGFLLSLVFVAVGLLVKALISGTSDPESWAHFALDARSLSHYFSLSGSFCGSFCGYFLMKRYLPFQVPEKDVLKAAAFLLGIVGVIFVLYGLDALFALLAADESLLGYLLRYIRYTSVALWAMVGAPWVFVRLGWSTLKR